MYNNKAAHIINISILSPGPMFPRNRLRHHSYYHFFFWTRTITVSLSWDANVPHSFNQMYAPAIIIREIIEDTIFCNYQLLFKNSNVIEKLSFLLLSTSVVGGRWMDLLLHGATYAFYKFTFREIDKIKIRNSNRNIILLRIKPIPNTTSSSA